MFGKKIKGRSKGLTERSIPVSIYFLSLLLLTLIAITAGACGGGSENDTDTCKGWECSGHGKCEIGYWGPVCKCDAGYLVSLDGKECTAAGPCKDQDCSGHGSCQVDARGKPYCECTKGFNSGPGLTCLPGCTSSSDCTDPYDAKCTDHGTLLRYSMPGSCNNGVCAYKETEDGCNELGCCKDHCCRIKPSNFGDTGWLEDTGLSGTASGTFDTVNDCKQGSMLGDCNLKEHKDRPDICICKLDTLSVTGTLKLKGDAALAVLASQTVDIQGNIDLSASNGSPGPGAEKFPMEESNTWYGGSGGSYGGRGGNVPADGYKERGSARIEPLIGGQNGQDGCGGRTGGGGGGALQITAGEKITMSGVINAGGGGGLGGNARTDAVEDKDCIGGAGGGSGGAVLLESLEVALTGTIAANGGGGGGGGNNDGEAGGNGSDATADLNPAAGGQGRDGHGCALQGNTQGGDGGLGAAGKTIEGGNGESYEWKQCPQHQNYLGGGGGGGGAGRIRVYTLGECRCAGTCSPPVSCGMPIGG
ncbi:MAG: hypothetical protein GXP49_11085 [Deltaproteobacteria bacterium]|nr:hypothetical protein [Deltaproteobacteria bacterium]